MFAVEQFTFLLLFLHPLSLFFLPHCLFVVLVICAESVRIREHCRWHCLFPDFLFLFACDTDTDTKWVCGGTRQWEITALYLTSSVSRERENRKRKHQGRRREKREKRLATSVDVCVCADDGDGDWRHFDPHTSSLSDYAFSDEEEEGTRGEWLPLPVKLPRMRLLSSTVATPGHHQHDHSVCCDSVELWWCASPPPPPPNDSSTVAPVQLLSTDCYPQMNDGGSSIWPFFTLSLSTDGSGNGTSHSYI